MFMHDFNEKQQQKKKKYSLLANILLLPTKWFPKPDAHES